MQRSFSLQPQARQNTFRQATDFMNIQQPYQPQQQPQVLPQRFNNQKLTKKDKIEQEKKEQRQSRKEYNQEILELSKLTKKQLREYLQDQIDDKSSEED
jgi:hypothetical protein